MKVRQWKAEEKGRKRKAEEESKKDPPKSPSKRKIMKFGWVGTHVEYCNHDRRWHRGRAEWPFFLATPGQARTAISSAKVVPV